MTFTPTQEQLTILDRIVSRTAPVIIVNAGPGCAKTTTIIEAIKLLAPSYKPEWKPGRCKMVYTAFNKDIVNETAAKLVTAGINREALYKVNCATFNSLGLYIWANSSARTRPDQRVTINTNKNKDILRDIQNAGRWSISPDQWGDYEQLMRMAKSQGYLPKGSGCAFGTFIDFKSLCDLADVQPEPGMQAVLDEAIRMSIVQSYNFVCDFDDQLYMSALFATYDEPGPDFLFVDEAQDLTPIQLFLLRRIKPKNLILVGDPMQAIYAFRGAMSDAFRRMYSMWPDAITLPLLTSFRVPRATIQLLRERNPNLLTASTVEGELLSPAESMPIKSLLALANKPSSRAILCRNNAPLYRVALACISAKIPFTLTDKTFGEGIIRDIKRTFPNPQNWPAGPQLIGALHTLWTDRAGDNPRKRAMALDKVAAIQALIEVTQTPTAGSLIIAIQSLLRASTDGVLLSTAHKAKGLEFEFVVHLDSHLIPSTFATQGEQLAQEMNIAYVINSRAKHTLCFIDSANITIPGSPARQITNPARRIPT